MNGLTQVEKKSEILNISDMIIQQSAFSTGYENNQRITVFYISDLHLGHHLDEEKPIKDQIKIIVRNMFDSKLIRMIKLSEPLIVIFGGDVSADFSITKIFYHEYMLLWDELLYERWKDINQYRILGHEEMARRKFEREWKVRFPVFAVLGNHELHAFETVKEAVVRYRHMCLKEGICFLHNEFVEDCKFKRENGYMVLGGTGFAKYNREYNAETLLGARYMSREDEIVESENFYNIYQKALKEASRKNKLLIVIAHYPIKDWLPEGKGNSRCVYFTGHTHGNDSIHSESVNIYDNQIGYYKKSICFKNVVLGTCYNPFIDYLDGTYEITTEQYMQFYDYNNDSLSGTGGIDLQLRTGVAKFYMIKQNGFYGFFVMNVKTGAKICVGGTVKTVSKEIDISYFSKAFSAMIEIFVTAMMPYRRYQEKIASEVKELGYEGKIHGCIIDLDFYNHIMINPLDGKVTFYYSPSYGFVREYRTISELIEDIEDYGMKELIEQKERALLLLENKKQDTNSLVVKNTVELRKYTKKMVKLDIKNSIYKTSSKIAQLQRLFDSNILREWNDELVHKIVREDSLL